MAFILIYSMRNITPELDQYASKRSTPEDALLVKLREFTYANIDQAQMQVGHVEGQLLKTLVKISGAKKVLELGTFTGYSALAMAMGLPKDGKVITCDIDQKVTAVAQKFWAKSPSGEKIELKLGPALEILQALNEEFDLVFIDADKTNYINYYEAVMPKMRSGGIIIIDNTLRGGRVMNPQSASDKVTAELNNLIAKDDRVEAVILTVRDGITIAIKK